MASVTDGLSNTIAIGEISVNSHDHFYDGSWSQYNGAASHASTIVPINTKSDSQAGCSAAMTAARNWNISWGFKSKHTGGANFVFVDGSVHFLQSSINMQLYCDLGCRNDGLTVSIP